MDLIYLYCVTKKEPELKGLTDLVDKLYFVYHSNLYAVVSNVAESEFSEESFKKNLADLEWIKIKASLHEKVIEGIMKNACVIPFKFGTLFNTEDSLKAMIEKHAEDLKENLENLEGKEEWGVKVYCDMEKLKRAIGEEETDILKIDKEIKASAPGKIYFLKKKKDELLKDAVQKRITEYGKDIFNLLNDLSLENRINKLLPKEVTEREDEMVLNLAFLVDKNKVSQFIELVNGFKAMYSDEGFSFDCTGPWPPYNFCSISEEKVKSEERL